jgi:hypothetical protein
MARPVLFAGPVLIEVERETAFIVFQPTRTPLHNLLPIRPNNVSPIKAHQE